MMPDREKVIKVLEYCVLSNDCRPCEYWIEFDDTGCQIMKDALALLKEQEAVEPKTGHWIVLEYCANEGIYCSECNMKIFDRLTKPKKKLSQYCPHCGSKNEQFLRNGEVVFR